MIFTDLFESRDICRVCGQTPCNCTHIVEGISLDALSKFANVIPSFAEKLGAAARQESKETWQMLQILKLKAQGKATPEQVEWMNKQFVDLAIIALGVGSLGYAAAAGAAAHGAAGAAAHVGKDALLHFVGEAGLETVAEVLSAKFGIDILKKLSHSITTSTGQGIEHSQEKAPQQYGVSPAVAAKNQRDLEQKFQQAKMGFGGMSEAAGELSVQQLATISDEALDNAYHYGRSTPGNTFGWQANLKSAAFAKRMIDAGVTDIEAIADAIHKGWNTTAQAFVSNPEQFDDTEKLRQAGKLEAKLQQRAQLMKQNYAQLPEEEKEKDRVVARALLQALRGEQGVAEGADDNILDEAAPWVDKLGLGNFFRKIQNVDANSQNEIRILSGLNHSMQLYFKTILALNAQAGPAASLFWPLLGKQALLFAGGAAAYTIGKILATKLGRALFGSTEEALAWAQAHLAAGKNKESKFEFDGKQYPVTVVDPASIANLEQQIAQLEGIVANKQNRAAKAEYQKSLRQPKKVYQGVTEMDTQQPKGRIKSDGTRSHSTYGSRDHYSDADPQHVAKPTKAEKMMKHAHDVMMKSMSTADKVKKGWRNPNIDEGSEEQVYKVVALDKGNALKKPTKLNVKASSIEDVFSRLAANDWYALSINGVEVVAGKRLKQGVAEGLLDAFKPKMKINIEEYDDENMDVSVTLGKEEIARFNFTVIGNDIEADDMSVKPAYRGQGIAKKVYDYLKTKGYNINRSQHQTDAGAHFWDKNKGQGSKVWEQGVAEGKIKLSTDPNWYGAEVGDYKASGPIVNIPANRLVGFEPDDKMNQPASKANVKKIVAGLKQGAKLPPLLVRQYKNGYQVLDGHHRFWAYKLLGVKSIPAQVVPAEDVEEVGKQGVAEVSDDTLTSYLSKVHADSQKHEKDPSKRSPAKRNRSVSGFSRAFNKLDARKEKVDEISLGDYPRKAALSRAQSQMAAATTRDPEQRAQHAKKALTRSAGIDRASARLSAQQKTAAAQSRAAADQALKDKYAGVDIDAEIARLQPALQSAYDDYQYGASNTWSQGRAQYDSISAKIKELQRAKQLLGQELDEVSKQRLGDYLHAAHQDVVDRASSGSFQSGQAGDKYNKADVSPKEKQRQIGMSRAVKRLTREGSSMAEAWARRYPNINADISECQAAGDSDRLKRLVAIKDIIDADLREQSGLGFGE